MHTIRTLTTLATDYLRGKNVKNSRREAEELLAHLLGKKRLDLYLDYDGPLEQSEVDRFRGWIKRKGKREPLEYIIEKVDFLGCNIKVNSQVLIPRKETEILVHMALKEKLGGVIWDLCTGSGCIGLAVKKHVPAAELVLADLSKGALKVAKSNAERNDLKVNFREGDLLTPFLGEKADVVFCNPPYVAEEDFQTLESEVQNFEPKMALIAKNRGYEFYERLSADLPEFLNAGARVYLEIGHGQGQKIKQLFNKKCWKRAAYVNDWACLERFFLLEFCP